MGSFAHEMKNPMTSIIGLRGAYPLPAAHSGGGAGRGELYIFRGQAAGEPVVQAAGYSGAQEKDRRASAVQSRRSLSAARWSTCGACSRRRTSCCSAAAREGMCMLEPDLVKSLLVNLLDNARKAMDGGGNIYVVSEMLPDGCASACSIPGAASRRRRSRTSRRRSTAWTNRVPARRAASASACRCAAR